MKTIGLMMILVFSALTGISLSLDAKKRCSVCHELVDMSDQIKMNLNYIICDTPSIIDDLKNNPQLKNLTFLNEFDFNFDYTIKTVLSKADDEKINAFFDCLGKSDVDSQLLMINAFKEYFDKRLNKYTEEYEKNRKLYTAFGIFGGVAIALMLS